MKNKGLYNLKKVCSLACLQVSSTGPVLSYISPVHLLTPLSLICILIQSSLLCLDLSNGLLPYNFPTTIVYIVITYTMQSTCPTHRILFDSMTREKIWRALRLLQLSTKNLNLRNTLDHKICYSAYSILQFK